MAKEQLPEKYLLGVYDDEQPVLKAVKDIRAEGIEVADVFSPFPIHGLDALMGFNRSRLPRVAFWAGFVGCGLAILMMTYMLVWDWPMDIGGKPHFSFPAFIPITFELTVLISALTMVGAYLYVNRLKPGIKAELADIRQTNDRIVILLQPHTDEEEQKARGLFAATGALDTRFVDLTPHVNFFRK